MKRTAPGKGGPISRSDKEGNALPPRLSLSYTICVEMSRRTDRQGVTDLVGNLILTHLGHEVNSEAVSDGKKLVREGIPPRDPSHEGSGDIVCPFCLHSAAGSGI